MTIATIVTIVGSVTAFLQQTFYLGRSSINILGTPCYVRSRALRLPSANDGERIALGIFHLPGFFGRQLEMTVSRGFYLSLQSESSDYLSVLRIPMIFRSMVHMDATLTSPLHPTSPIYTSCQHILAHEEHKRQQTLRLRYRLVWCISQEASKKKKRMTCMCRATANVELCR